MDLFILKHKFICTKKIFLHLRNPRRNDFLCFEPQEVISERHQKILKGICGEISAADEEVLPKTSTDTI
jgi:hypothetical protein